MNKRKIYQFITGLTLGGLACLGVQQVDEKLHVEAYWGEKPALNRPVPLPEFALLSQIDEREKFWLCLERQQSVEHCKKLTENIDAGE